MHFNCGLVFAETRPWKDRQAEINGRRIESVRGLDEIDTEAVVCIQKSGAGNQHLSEVSPDTPVTVFVGVGKSASASPAPETCMVEFGTNRIETGLDISETFTTCKLRECHGEELVEAGQFSDAMVSVIPVDTEIELVMGNVIEELGEDDPALVHRWLPGWGERGGLPDQLAKFKSKKGRTALICPW